MIKLIIFDLDGVLVSTKQLHFDSFNLALKDFGVPEISYEDHLAYYDGLPTMKKLKTYTKRNQTISEENYNIINKSKQKYTIDLIKNIIPYDLRLVNIFKQLKDDGHKIYVASNSIRETTKLLLYKSGVMEYVEVFVSNEDVKNPKPNSEMYLSCMTHAGVNPKETLIIEDSPVGIEGATNACGHLLIVKNPEDVHYEKIKEKIASIEKTNKHLLSLDNLNILIPMEGMGSRFSEAGYIFPKPLIEVNGKPMIQVVIESLGIKAHYIYVVQKEHYDKYNLQYMLNLITPGCDIVTSENKKYSGATGAVLCAEHLIDNDNPLIIANSDQYIEWNPIEFYYKMSESKADGGILTFKNTHPKWSYVKMDDEDNVTELKEKIVISDDATVGVYYYTKGNEFLKYAKQMISNEDNKVNNEYYVAPVYNEYIKDKKKIKIHNVDKMMGLGTPSDLDYFLREYKQ